MSMQIPSRYNKMVVYKRPSSPTPPEPSFLTIPLTFKSTNGTSVIQLVDDIGDYTDDGISYPTLEYSLNNGSWTSYTIGDQITLNEGDTVAFSGNNDHFNGILSQNWSNRRLHFKGTGGNHQIYGNIMSLLTSDFANVIDFSMIDSTIWERAPFFELFMLDTTLIGAQNLILPATTLYDGCYHDMFKTPSLVVPPKILPATYADSNVSFCYHHMFDSAYALTATPEVCLTGQESDMATHGMFENCTNLVEAKVHYQDWSNVPSNMFNNVGSNGTFYKPSNSTPPEGLIPYDWTIVDF